MPAIKIFTKKTVTLKVTVYEKDPETGERIGVFDLTGYSSVLTVRRNKVEFNQLFQISGNIDTDPTTGVIRFDVSTTNSAPENAGIHAYDVTITNGSLSYIVIEPSPFEIVLTATR